MRGVILFGLILLLAACTSQTDSGKEKGYAALVGTWVSPVDSGSGLEITRACCGTRSQVTGSLKWYGAVLSIGPASTVNDYSVIRPDSGSSTIHIIALNLDLNGESEGALCKLDGVAESDGTGHSGSRPLAISALRLLRWVLGPTGCEATTDSLEWVKAR